MSDYSEHYQKKNYFGEPYPEIVEYFDSLSRGTIVDLGAGQGRDSLFLARLGYDVTAVDVSEVGLEQLSEINPDIKNIVGDMNDVPLKGFDYILMDSMIHFYKRDKKYEVNMLEKIHQQRDVNSLLVLIFLYSKERENILHKINIGTEEFSQKIMYNEFKSEFMIKAIRK